MWKKHFLLGALIVLLALNLPGYAAAVDWAKYVTVDDSFSFHYPQGWTVTETESGFMIHEPDTFEQLWMVVLPYQDHWTAEEHAQFFLSVIQEDNPEMQATAWAYAKDSVFFELLYGNGQDRAEGMGLVLKDSQFEQALWFHYLTPSDAYIAERAETILEGFVNSLATGATSMPPEGRTAVSEPLDRMERIDRNADAFLFILEFALGTPLSLWEETMVLTELKGAWTDYSDAELAPYDDYPGIVEAIMYLADQTELAELQEVLASSLWEWIEESDSDDPIVNPIHVHMLKADRRLVDGVIPLTERAATAYAEFLAYAELLEQEASATPDMIERNVVEEIKDQLIQAWTQFGEEEQEQIAALPAVWTTLRRVMRHGDSSDQDFARNTVRQAASKKEPAASDGGSAGEAMSWIAHQNMLWSNQQTFNHYMWCRGYHATPFGY